MKSITFITGNLNKVTWTQRYIHLPMEHKQLDLLEIQSLDPQKVVEHKVKQAYELLKTPVLVEDTSLVFNALGNLPGPFIKWFLQELGNDGLCTLVKENRSATASVIFGFYDGKNLNFFEGSITGMIAQSPKGKSGFGWDSIFIPDGQTKTYAEMTPEEHDTISMRRIALEKMKKELNNI